MKAYQIMMFMLLFSLSISVINVLHIYNIENQIDPTDQNDPAEGINYDVSDYQASSAGTVTGRFFGDLMLGIIAGVIAATITSYFTRVPADAAFAYGLFGGAFWGIAKNALGVIWRIKPGDEGIMIILVIFAIILSASFVVGILQMIRGGWESYV